MRVQFNTLKNKLLYDNFYAGKTLFYKRCNYYYYSRVDTFGRLFDILVIGLGIFKPSLLQTDHSKTWIDTTIKERKKIKIGTEGIKNTIPRTQRRIFNRRDNSETTIHEMFFYFAKIIRCIY